MGKIKESCNYVATNYYGNYYLPLKNLFNDMYAKEISKKVRSSLIVKKYNGEITCKLATYGYVKAPKDKHTFLITPSEYLKINIDKDTTIMKKWNPEMVNSILKNENHTGTLFQGKKRKLNYRIDKKIKLDKENWIVTKNHHEAIISKENFDKV